jgi:heme/copper-type cytochrome/quinol oxidase subunit 2
VFEEVLGIPAHPLLVHAAVVFVPLQILAAFAYAFVPFVRRFIAWLVIGLAMVAPMSVLLAKLSGDAFQARLIRNGTADPVFLAQIKQHNSYGDTTLYLSIALSALIILLMFVQVWRSRPTTGAAPDKPDTSQPAKGPIVVAAVLTVAVLAAGVATGYFVFKTGDSGAHMVWSGR